MLKRVHLIHTKHSNLDPRQNRLLRAEHFLARKTDFIIADAQDVAKFMVEKQGMPLSKIKLIFNGIDIKRFSAVKKEFTKTKKTIGIIARLAGVKDHATLLSAFQIVNRKLPETELLIIGDGPTRNSLQSIADSQQLKDKVFFLGTRRDTPELMAQMDVFVLSSLSEGMSIALLEAMAAGLPVVTTNVGGNPEIVKDNETGFLVPPKNPELLAEKIITLLSDQKLAAAMGEMGRRRAEEYFSINKMARSYEQLYDALELIHNDSAKVSLIGEFPPQLGGMAVQAQLLGEKLKEEGICVSILKRHCEFPQGLKWLGKVRVLRSLIYLLVFKIKLIKQVFNTGALYIFTNSYLNFYLYTLLPVAWGRLLRRKIIINFHGGAADEFLSSPEHFLARNTLKKANYIIVPSAYLKDIFQKLGLAAIVIPNIAETARFDFKERKILSPNFIITRHLEPEYNIEMALRTFSLVRAKLPAAKLVICGNGSQEQHLKCIANELSLGDAVEFTGKVNREGIAELYRQSDIFLNSSNIDNQPVAILEAFACGLPVVTTKAGGIPDLVENGKTGLLVDLNDYADMAKSIERLLKEPELVHKLTINARNSLSKYSWDNIKIKLLPLLTEKPALGWRINFYQNFIFRLLDAVRGRKNIEKLEFLRNSQYWPKEDMEAWQLNKLNELLAIAKNKSPFYRERLKNLNLPLSSLNELQNIPVLSKKDIRQNLDKIKCEGVPQDLFILGKTGGSTGEPMHYYYDKRGRDWNRASVYRSQEWSGAFLGEKTLQMTGSHYDETEFKKFKNRLILALQRYKYLPISFVNDELLEKYYQELLRYKPTNIWGYSSAIYLFAKFIEEKHKGADFNFLKAIITSSETLFDHQRKKINKIFGEGKVFDHYGSREIYIASECREHSGYHIHSEVVIAEVVNQEGKPKKPGEAGRILITDLSNRVFPFIRYEIGDVGIMGQEETCACGITLPKLTKIEGRIADVVVLPDRILTPPNFTILLSDYEGIEEYQIIQKSKTELILNIVKNSGFKAEYEEYIKKSLSQLLGPTVELKLEYVNSITIPESGKRRYIISEVSQNEL